MDYIIDANGVKILIEEHTDEERNSDMYKQRKRLLKYYELLLKDKNIDKNSKKYNALVNMVDSLTEERAKESANRFDEKLLKRLLAYNAMLNSKDTMLNDMADALDEILEATCEDEKSNEVTVAINGNKFIFDKECIDLEKYSKRLAEIGDRTKGNTWKIYLDNDGELVIY